MGDPKIPGGYYIKARKIQESAISRQPPHVREIWDYLLREANHSDQAYRGYFIKRGQLFRTLGEIREALSWQVGWRKQKYNENQTKKAMKFLREALMITTRKEPGGVMITVLNYDLYQCPANYERTKEGTSERTIDEPMKNQTAPYNKKEEEIDKDNLNILSENSDHTRRENGGDGERGKNINMDFYLHDLDSDDIEHCQDKHSAQGRRAASVSHGEASESNGEDRGTTQSAREITTQGGDDGAHDTMGETGSPGGEIPKAPREQLETGPLHGNPREAGGEPGEDLPDATNIDSGSVALDRTGNKNGFSSGVEGAGREIDKRSDDVHVQPGGQVNDNLEAKTNDPVKPAAKKKEEPRYRTRKKRWLKGQRLEDFLQFWKIFDDKRSKAAAADSWLDLEDYSPELVKAILHGARMYAQDRQDILLSKGTPKMGQGWLTDRRWEDYVVEDNQRKGGRKIDVKKEIADMRARAKQLDIRDASKQRKNGTKIQTPSIKIVEPDAGADSVTTTNESPGSALRQLFG